MARDPDAPFRALYRRLARLTLEHPDTGLRLAGALGRAAGARAGPGFTLTRGEAGALFGALGARERDQLRARIASQELRNRCLRALVRERGIDALFARLHVVAGGEALHELLRDKVPVIGVGWHAGAFRAVALAPRKLGIPTLLATGKPLGRALQQSDPLLHYVPVHADTLARTGFLKRALEHVTQGGVPFFFVDSPLERGAEPMAFLGRSLPLARGAATLARLARGRLVPITSRWVGLGARIEVTIHPPLPEPAVPRGSAREHDRAQLEGVARFFEAQVGAQPEQMRLWRWRDLLAAAAPPAAPD